MAAPDDGLARDLGPEETPEAEAPMTVVERRAATL